MSITRARAWVALITGVALLFKVMVAFRTYGTGDIGRWQDFADGVRSSGPVGVYALRWPSSFYNHPPAIGYFLEFVNGMQDLGVSLGATIRVSASLADVGTAFLVLELLRRRTTLVRATWSGVLVAVSPVLFTVSGYHGNTDPIFTMLTLLSVWLLADKNRPVLAGMSMGLAIGIKIVPIVAVPALLVYAATLGARAFWRCAAGGALVFLVTWGPALALQGHDVIADVIGYKGSDLRQWGLIQIGHWLGDPWWAHLLIGPGRFLVLGLCCAGPAYLVWRRPWTLPGAVGLSLVGFLLLSPAFGVQYAVWPLAGAYLIGFTSATAYNLTAGLMLVAIYNRWSGGLPWDRAHASKYTPTEVFFGMGAWLALLWVAVVGVRTLWSGVEPEPETRPRTKSRTRRPVEIQDGAVTAPDGPTSRHV